MKLRNNQGLQVVICLKVEAEKHSAGLNAVKGFKVDDNSEKEDFKCGGGGGDNSSSSSSSTTRGADKSLA